MASTMQASCASAVGGKPFSSTPASPMGGGVKQAGGLTTPDQRETTSRVGSRPARLLVTGGTAGALASLALRMVAGGGAAATPRWARFSWPMAPTDDSALYVSEVITLLALLTAAPLAAHELHAARSGAAAGARGAKGAPLV